MHNHYQIGLRVRVGAAPVNAAAATLRGEAQGVAQAQPANVNFVGVWYKKDGTNGFVTPATRSDLDDWYGNIADQQSTYAYVAAFDRTDTTSWPDPWAEFGDSILTATVTAKPPAPKPAPQKQESNLGMYFAIGAAGLAGLVAAGKKKRRV